MDLDLPSQGSWLTPAKVERAARRAGGIHVDAVGRSTSGRFVARLVFADPWAAARFLVEVAKEDVGDPILWRIAAGIRARSSSDRAYAENVQAWVQNNIRFAKEPVETFQAGRATVETRVGDCDCHAKLVYALLRTDGVPASISFLEAHGAPRHACANAIVGGRRVPLETTIKARFGEEPLVAARRLGIRTRPDLAEGKTVTIGDMGETVEGIDLAQYAGKVDWKTVAGAAEFAFIRTGDGMGTDRTFDYNWKAAHDAGIVCGPYQFFSPPLDPVAQADHLIAQVGGSLALLDLPPVVDFETLRHVDPRDAVIAIAKWAARIQDKLRCLPILYTSPGFYNAVPASAFDGSLPLWVAHWGVRSPTLPRGWKSWDFWQYAENKPFTGVGGMVDVDVFNGSKGALRAYAAKKASPPEAGGSGSSGAGLLSPASPLEPSPPDCPGASEGGTDDESG